MKVEPGQYTVRLIPGACQHVLIFLFILLPFFAAPVFGSQVVLTVLPAPVLTSELFPCSKCHNKTDKGLESGKQGVHKAIPLEGHIEESYNCFGCHDRENLDKLNLFNGAKIDLFLSSSLCGQCHSSSYKLWKSGLHGKISGKWNGQKKINPCVNCHDPHHPGYEKQRPKPPPTPPEKTLRW